MPQTSLAISTLFIAILAANVSVGYGFRKAGQATEQPMWTLNVDPGADPGAESAPLEGDGTKFSEHGSGDMPFVNTFDLSPCSATPIHCGQSYFKEVYEQFQTANEIIIMGWRTLFNVKLFAPEIGDAPSLTLKDLMVSAAKRGAQIYFIFWKSQVSEKMGLGVRDYRKEIKSWGQDNIHTLIDTARSSVMLVWSAHIKVAIFDRKVAFAGGIDFADTRLDTPAHLLPDTTRVPFADNGHPQHGYGKPWQDMVVKVTGQAALDLATVAVERWWTFCEFRFRKSTQQCDLPNRPRLSEMGELRFKMLSRPDNKSRGSLKLLRGFDRKADIEKVREIGEEKKLALGGRHDLGKGLSLTVSISRGATVARSASQEVLFKDLADGEPHTVNVSAGWEAELQWDKQHADEDWRALAPQGAGHQCQVILSGDYNWLGASRPVRDTLFHHKRMIREAKSSVYIENQYFSSKLAGCDWMKSHNDVAQELYDKITSKALSKEPFSAIVVFPLATEEAETHYGNMRTAECMHTALTSFWGKHNIEAPLQDYFGLYHLANVVPVPDESDTSAFYGIFVHSKLIIVDYDTEEGGEAIVGSANINDRSLSGDGDAEVGVRVTGGGFPRTMMEELMSYHIGAERTPEQGRLAATVAAAAAKNVGHLMSVNLDWTEGTIDGKPFLNQNGESPIAPGDEAFKIGSGVHWYTFNKGAQMDGPFEGHLVPWSPKVWGAAAKYWSKAHHLPKVAWLQEGEKSVDQVLS